MAELAVVMPVYNEEGAIPAVLEKWSRAFDALGIDYRLHAYNDGSTDKTAEILASLAGKYPRLCVHNKENSGHGPTVLAGYREAVDVTWIFQTDSDDEMAPESFPALWEQRGRYDFLIGRRDKRHSPLPRRIVSLVSRLAVKVCYGRGVWDVNSPYRLMRRVCFARLFDRVPADTFAPNVIVSGFACRRKLRILEIPVPHHERRTGVVSVRKWKLLKAAAKSLAQTLRFAMTRPRPD